MYASFHFIVCNYCNIMCLIENMFTYQDSCTVKITCNEKCWHQNPKKTWSLRNFIRFYGTWPYNCWTTWLLFLVSETKYAKAFNLRFNFMLTMSFVLSIRNCYGTLDYFCFRCLFTLITNKFEKSTPNIINNNNKTKLKAKKNLRFSIQENGNAQKWEKKM